MGGAPWASGFARRRGWRKVGDDGSRSHRDVWSGIGTSVDHVFPATRADALLRLAEFLPRAGRLYQRDRNHDTGPGLRGNVSCLAAALRRRLVTEAEVARAVREEHGSDAYKFLAEVGWRTYFRGWLELRPAVWRRYRAELERDTARLGTEPSLAKAYARAVRGETGIDAFDAWNAELMATGYVHNHSRMNYASIWTFTLGLPWTLGAAHFGRNLLCACPAANTLNWRWVVGLQTAGKAYRANVGTIRAMSGGRHAVDGPLAARVKALREPPPPPPGAVPAPPPPDPSRSGLFVTTEDLTCEQHDFGDAEIVAVAGVDRIGGEPSDLKRAHAETALADGVARAAEHWAVAPAQIDGTEPAAALVAWAEARGLDQIVTPYAPVGEVADLLSAAEPMLAACGVRLSRVLRPYDAQAWPHAARGYAHFRQHFDPSQVQ